MPTLKPRELRDREGLCKKYRIEFIRDGDNIAWPERLTKTFQDARKLGETKFDLYAVRASDNVENEPWKLERKSHAKVLTDIADRCRHRNEASWRQACEPFILSRLSAEVCCRECRNRIWRSEIEATRSEDSAAASKLLNRQQTRRPCRCPRERRSQDMLEAVGLNQIFNFRVDEEVHHDPNVVKDLGKREQPDRVYGLRQTRNIENLLNDLAILQDDQDPESEGNQVQEILGLSPSNQPMNQSGDRQLFPFLVLEAKSGSSGDDWHSIQMQTAFSIRTILETQYRLKKAASTNSRWHAGPMVWFLSNRGEDWRLSAGYTEDNAPTRHTVGTVNYNVVNLWSGSILSRNGALQLLLLVDYIFDWARDIYREDIIRELKVLASGDNDTASTIGFDNDIQSIRMVYSADQYGVEDQENEDKDFENYKAAQAPFLQCKYLASSSLEIKLRDNEVRHATFIESKFSCLFVTGDNVQTLLQSTQENKVQPFTRLILKHMAQPLIIDLRTLDALEKEWTGGSSRTASFSSFQSVFYTIITCTAYFTENWGLVRELSVIAIAKDAWPVFYAATGLKRSMKSFDRNEKNDAEELLKMVQRLQAGTSKDILLNSIVRRALRISYTTADRSNPKIVFLSTDGSIRELVQCVYNHLIRGTLAPQEPFLRFSSRFDQQHLMNQELQPFYFDDAEELHLSDDACVIVSATESTDWGRTFEGRCLFLTDGQPSLPTEIVLKDMFRRTFENCDIYHTSRRSSPLSTSAVLQTGANSISWNIPNSYSVYYRGFTFSNLISALNCPAPVTQGCLRLSSSDGSYLHKRNFHPWEDPRGRRSGYFHLEGKRLFILYKLFAKEFFFWQTLARKRAADGIPCCSYCAYIQENAVCEHCNAVLKDQSRPVWYQEILTSKISSDGQPLDKNQIRNLKIMEPGTMLSWALFSEGKRKLRHCYQGKFLNTNITYVYQQLNKPFSDIKQLSEQWDEFKVYCNGFTDRFYTSTIPKKRKRVNEDEDAQGDVSNPILID